MPSSPGLVGERRLVRICRARELRGPLGGLVEGVAQRVRQHCDRAKVDRRVRAALDLHHAVDDLQVVDGSFERVGRDPQCLLPHLARGHGDRTSRHHRSTRREGPDGVLEATGVPCRHRDPVHRHAEFVCHDLRQHRLVALALCGQAGRDDHRAVGLDPDVSAFVRTRLRCPRHSKPARCRPVGPRCAPARGMPRTRPSPPAP